MFTGIIEEIGIVKSFQKNSEGAELEITCKKILENTNLGDSIAINGVCQTVVKIFTDGFKVQISPETLSVTTLGNLKINQPINLERALTLNSRLGGHIVSGHVDCLGKLTELEQLKNFYNLKFELPKQQSKYVVHKGSITVDGVSLTVASIDENVFKVAIIPHTYQNTILKYLKIGNFVNIETDILGKYVEKMLSARDNKESSISIEFLRENGFV